MTNNMKRLLKGFAILCETVAFSAFLVVEPRWFLLDIVYPGVAVFFCSWFIGAVISQPPPNK